jgi:hypothetical protein
MGVQPKVHARVKQMPPMTALVIGPTMPIQNSVLGSTASFSMLATPPRANRVMARTGNPRVFATRACDNSCTSRAAKKSSPVRIARVQITPLPHSGRMAEKCMPSEDMINSAMRNQL